MSDTLLDELSAIKDVEDTVVGNKVANFAYDDYAYEHNDANGVDTYNVNNHQNIPNGTASVMKVNSTVLTKGWRAQASAITRMLMNHFLGRVSYNLNKLHDNFSGMLNNLISYIGEPNGLATLNSEGKVTALNNVANTSDSDVPAENGTNKFTTGGMFNFLSSIFQPFTEGTSKRYSKDNYYFYQGKLYACKEDVTLTNFDPSYFTERRILSSRNNFVVTHKPSDETGFWNWRPRNITVLVEDQGSSWIVYTRDLRAPANYVVEYVLIRASGITHGTVSVRKDSLTRLVELNANEVAVVMAIGESDIPLVGA